MSFFSQKGDLIKKMVKGKLKPILPSLREKRRYLAFEIVSKTRMTDFKAVSEAIKQNMLDLFGQVGYAKSALYILPDKYISEKQKGIIRINHKHVDDLRASLALIKSINNNEVVVKSIGVSGILKKAEERYLK